MLSWVKMESGGGSGDCIGTGWAMYCGGLEKVTIWFGLYGDVVGLHGRERLGYIMLSEDELNHIIKAK